MGIIEVLGIASGVAQLIGSLFGGQEYRHPFAENPELTALLANKIAKEGGFGDDWVKPIMQALMNYRVPTGQPNLASRVGGFGNFIAQFIPMAYQIQQSNKYEPVVQQLLSIIMGRYGAIGQRADGSYVFASPFMNPLLSALAGR